MEHLSLISYILITVLAFAGELIDSSMGMLYGTLLTPFLIILGFEAGVAVPAVLLSQAVGGLTASYFHHRFQNGDFSIKDKQLSKDFKIVLVVTSLGILATIFSVFVAVSIPKIYVKLYIATLVIMMGILVLRKITFNFSWKKLYGIGILSAFNKGLTGGGYGPVVTSGQTIIGNHYKSTVATTTFAEGPICIVGFLTYFILKGFSDWQFLLALTLGAALAAPIGALLTSKFNEAKVKPILGWLTIISGTWMLIQTLLCIASFG